MVGSAEEGRETIRPEFNRAIMIDFQVVGITSDTGSCCSERLTNVLGLLDRWPGNLRIGDRLFTQDSHWFK